VESHYKTINDLVIRVREGDGAALAELRQFYLPLLIAALRRCVTREPRIANFRDDIEGELLLILRDIVHQYDPALSYFSYYLSTRIDYAIMARARKLLHQNSSGQGIEEIKFSEMPSSWEPVDQEDPFGRIEQELAVQAAIDQLSNAHREVIELYFFQDMTQETAAAQLGITQASFSRRMGRALAQLKKLLSDT
jgi:RNA polymerase sigma factor (sigma-70 family)